MERSETDSDDSSGGYVATRIRAKREHVAQRDSRMHRHSKEPRDVNKETVDSIKISGSNNHHTIGQTESRLSGADPSKTDFKEEETFKSWLTARIMDGLNTAAGATLSTTGQLIAPPLHVTKTIILPSLLSLFVDTLDVVTPQRLKDWFRILSSSIHHLVSVIRSTKAGKQFSSRFLDVTKDIALVTSAPETRNVLIDAMAFGVKVLDALNTKEVRILMDHVALLACRIADAAASGKTKQLFHSMKGMIQDGIEMGSDPAATLAFAEVTAHLCYALEDIYTSLEPNNRQVRNQQNRETYLSPLEVSELQNQPSVEEVILSCLGRLDHSETNSADLPRRGETKDLSNLNNRIDTVDIKYLRSNVCFESEATALSHESADGNNDAFAEQTSSNTNDIEDLNERGEDWQKEVSKDSGQDATYQTLSEPPVRQFYETLDNFLQKDRSKPRGTGSAPSLYNTTGRRRGEEKQAEMLRAKVQKLKSRLNSTTPVMHNTDKNRLPAKQPRIASFAGSTFVLTLVVLWFGFGAYGVYSFTKTHFMKKGDGTRNPVEQLHLQQSEIVFRIVREVRHYNADEKEATTFSTEQHLDSLAECISSRFEIDGEKYV